MPWGDGTGPWGMGPRTGLGLGYCNGYDRPGYANPLNRGGGRGYGYGLGRGFGRGWGRGYGRGYGYGRGFRFRAGFGGYGYYAPYAYNPYPYGVNSNASTQSNYTPYDSESEKEYLKNYLKDIENEQEYIKKRLEELEQKEKSNEQ